MKSCTSCRKRETCVKLCAEVEARLPKETTGRDTRREVSVSEKGMQAAMDRHAFSAWLRVERGKAGPKLDLSVLTPKQRKAVMLVTSGLGYREAARRLGISLNALQTRVNAARRRLEAGQSAQLAEREKTGRGGESDE